MKKKNSGLTAAGKTQPEIRPGDIFKDLRGNLITIKTVTPVRVSFQRKGYSAECACSPQRVLSEFTPVKQQSFSEWGKTSNVAEKIKSLRALVAAKRAEK
ncbi:MAG: DUF4222 domain-containing protein [Hafnia sp.]